MSTESNEQTKTADDGAFEPKILVFCCNWCSYAGADLAGVSRLQMPSNFRVIRVMCSGRVDPEHLLKAFSLGADGILVAGCHPADCHYIGGNYRTRRRIPLLKIMISQFGLEPSRLQLDWISASEGERFQQVITNFIQHIKELGPSPVGGG
jgi:F420-non-reducing hydrogenase iron-sulfur subunit